MPAFSIPLAAREASCWRRPIFIVSPVTAVGLRHRWGTARVLHTLRWNGGYTQAASGERWFQAI